ncbi:MAG: class I SAM-dependent methyltransferase, partial [Actinobacteria bacterium]|nr:class I SAM-dependent methyltransferase [Actinomycetota bacterium]
MLSWMSQPTRYLEIGLDDGWTFVNVSADSAIGIDPVPRLNQSDLPKGREIFTEPSDSYFARQVDSHLFDVVFVDGLHTAEQTLRDLQSSFRVLKPNGVVVIDDVIPSDAISAIPDQAESLRRRELAGLPGTAWHGDVFRIIGAIAACSEWLDWVTIDDRKVDDRRNPQTLVWRTTDLNFQPDFLRPESLLSESFEDVFRHGPPEVFRARSEHDA